MPASSKTFKAAFSHSEGEEPCSRQYGLRIRSLANGKITVSVKRTAGTAAGKLTVYKTNSEEAQNIKLDSKSWSDSSTKIVDEADASFSFIVLEAEFTDNKFGQIEVEITN